MKDGGSGVCSTMQVRLMSLPLLMYNSELPLIFAFDTANIVQASVRTLHLDVTLKLTVEKIDSLFCIFSTNIV